MVWLVFAAFAVLIAVVLAAMFGWTVELFNEGGRDE